MATTEGTADVSVAPRTARPLLLRLYVMMFLQYFVQGCYLPIISVYLQDALGFGSDALGLFGSALAVGPLVAPFIIGQLVDRHLATQTVLAFCHVAGGVVMLALYWIEPLWQAVSQLASWQVSLFVPVVVLGTIYSTLYVPSLMLTNSLTFHHLKDRDREFPLVRLWGTIGFVAPAWLVEMYYLKGLSGDELNQARGIVLALAGAGGLIMGLYSLTLPHTPPARGQTRDLAPGKVLGLLRRRDFLVLVLVGFLVAIVHKFYFVWNSPFLRTILASGGIEAAWEQRISSIGQISEVAVMFGLGASVVARGFRRTMLYGITAYLLRCLIFAVAVAAPWPFVTRMVWVGVGQALHGFCFGCFLAAAFMYVDRIGSADIRGSMQNFYGTFVLGAGFFVGGIISGRIGAIFTTPVGTPTLRERIGIDATPGLTLFQQQAESGEMLAWMRDWPAIWLSCAAMALVALVVFALTFPRASEEPEETTEEPEETPLRSE